jgi:hypothetical protein
MADWKKQDLLDDLATMYIGIGTPENPGGEGTINGVIKYLVNVNELGKSEPNKKPTGYRKNVIFYVYHEGLGDEIAWYERVEPVNTSDGDVSTASTSAYSYDKIFTSTELRKRTNGFILKAIVSIINEDPGTTDHVLRLKWAYDCMKAPVKYLDAFMVTLANNTTVRSQGNAVIDGDMEWIINSEIIIVGTAFGFTN